MYMQTTAWQKYLSLIIVMTEIFKWPKWAHRINLSHIVYYEQQKLLTRRVDKTEQTTTPLAPSRTAFAKKHD